MAGDWQTMTLGEAIELKRGYDLPKNTRTQGSIPVVSSSGVSGTHSEFKVKAPGVVTGRYGTIGQVYFVTEDFWPLNTTLYVRDFKGNEPRFISYFLSQIDFHSCSDKAAVPGVNRNHLHELRVNLPPIEVQKSISHILGTLDDKIELNRRMNTTLEAMARALFQSWFVDFDPVRINAEGGDSRPEDALFPDSFEDSAIGEVPKGWQVCPMSKVIEVNPKRVLKKGSMAPYLDMKNLPTQGHSADDVIDREFSSGTKFQNGDTLLARITPCLENGKTGFVDFLEDGQVGWGSTEFITLAPKPPLPPQFGYLLARSDSLRAHAIQNMVGTSGRQRVPYECFDNFQIAVPPQEIAIRFELVTAPLMDKIKANSLECRTLAALRDTLLPKLLAGDVSILNSY